MAGDQKLEKEDYNLGDALNGVSDDLLDDPLDGIEDDLQEKTCSYHRYSHRYLRKVFKLVPVPFLISRLNSVIRNRHKFHIFKFP